MHILCLLITLAPFTNETTYINAYYRLSEKIKRLDLIQWLALTKSGFYNRKNQSE